MKRLLTLLTLLGACLYAGAQKKAVAVIEAYDAAFTLQSAVTGTLHVRYTVTVQDKAGLREAAVYIYTDTFASLGSFSGEIVSATGEKTKLSRKDLTSVAYSSGLVDDGFLHAYAPSQATRLPLTVTYDYTLQYKKGVISFPAFAPLDGAGVQLKRASCSIEVPEGTQIIQYAAHVEAHDPVTEKKRTVYRWEAGPVGPFADEEMAPPAFERIPLVLAAPVDFSYAGTKGTQSGWKEYGAWLYSLQEGADSLPDELTARLQEMTRDCKTPLEKLKVLYGFLREQTRYVSIQLGIGGLKPAPAEEVARTGYGDCKALSNYLKALLKAHRLRRMHEPAGAPGIPAPPRRRARGRPDRAGRRETVPHRKLPGLAPTPHTGNGSQPFRKRRGLRPDPPSPLSGLYRALSGLLHLEGGRPDPHPDRRHEVPDGAATGRIHH